MALYRSPSYEALIRQRFDLYDELSRLILPLDINSKAYDKIWDRRITVANQIVQCNRILEKTDPFIRR
ncbi:MAG: hypothetical protein HUJ96_06120 [Marinilabiliaceae bacterium]|nr:hypothetical protein [Marinilabiliaceae bacterium]